MTWWQIAMLVAVILAADLAVIGAIASMCAASIRPLADAFPPVPPAPDAVLKRRQSFRFDSINLGGCIHVAVDDRYLHLTPAWLARRFGFKDISVPWGELKNVRLKGRRADAQLRGVNVRGPAWCMSLAAPGAQQTADAENRSA